MAEFTIPKLRCNDHDVCVSNLTQRPHRAASCELLLKVTQANYERALKAFKRAGEFGEYSGLSVHGVADLSFLKEFPMLLYLEIHGTKSVDLRPLEALHNLRGLRLESPGMGIDFAWFPHLEVFMGDWHRGNRQLARCQELRRLAIWHFQPSSADLSDLAHLVRLEQLSITQTSIATLSGLETLEDLRYLDLAYAPKLASLDGLAGSELCELSLSKAKRIQTYEPIAAIENLRRLLLSDCAAMPDLQWVRRLRQLDFFTFMGTAVTNGDLAPLLDLPQLRYVATLGKKHYNYKSQDLNAILAGRKQF